jgi:glycosyltransferase involved in cell wall biosynthesis
MRVLVIDEALPWPPDSGKRIRTYELMRRLAGTFEILFAYHEEAPTSAEARQAFAEAGIELHPVPRRPLRKTGWRFLWDLGRNVFLRVPYMVMAHRTRAMRQFVRRSATEGSIDLVHAEWTPLVSNVPDDVRERVPVCIAAHNVEAQIWQRYLENEKNLFRRAYVALQARKVRRFEEGALREADAVVAVSAEDGARIEEMGQEHVSVATNGVDARTFAPRPDADVVPGSMLFVGSLDWRPNLDAVSFFLDEIWPEIRPRRPDATFTVVGRYPPEALVRRAEALDGVKLAAGVADVRPYVSRAAVSIVPLRIGGGSRLKICEALAMGRPVVSTSVGAEGLDLGDGIVKADGAPAFAAAVLRMLDAPEEAEATAKRGRERVLDRYDWDRIAPLQGYAWNAAVERGAQS